MGERSHALHIVCPWTSQEAKIQSVLKAASEGDEQGASVNLDSSKWRSTRPIYIRTNEYMETFHEIVDT